MSSNYIERFYNPTRRHSTIVYLSSIEFESNFGLAGRYSKAILVVALPGNLRRRVINNAWATLH